MNERAMQDAQDADAAMRAYVQDAAGSGGGNVSAEMRAARRPARLRRTLTAEEYEAAKAKVLA